MQGRGWALLQAVQKKHPMKCAGVAGRRVRAQPSLSIGSERSPAAQSTQPSSLRHGFPIPKGGETSRSARQKMDKGPQASRGELAPYGD